MVRLNMIVAYCMPKKGIGFQNKLPWHLPCDLKRFKSLTKNSTVITGRNTYESLPLHKFKDRDIAVITRNETIPNSFYSVSNCLKHYSSIKDKDEIIWIIGGSCLYEYILKNYIMNKIYITEIHKAFPCDILFKGFKEDNYILTEETYGKENNIPYIFKTYTSKEDIMDISFNTPSNFRSSYYLNSFEPSIKS